MTRAVVGRLSIAALMSVVALPGRAAGTSTFSVNPVQIHLTAKSPSTLLSVRNDSDHELRFQLSAFAWDQTPQDQMRLLPTSDIVFYPPLITLAPKEQRKIRIGTSTTFGAQEKAYRVFVEELPYLDRNGENTTGITVLTKMGIPIFLDATRAVAQATLEEISTHDGQISFRLRNTGNTHFVADKIVVRGFGGAGDVVFDTPISGWYVLAGRVRAYQIDIPEQDCARVTAATVKVQIGTSVLDERLATPAACRP
jgi:fimbrial chaperone protein